MERARIRNEYSVTLLFLLSFWLYLATPHLVYAAIDPSDTTSTPSTTGSGSTSIVSPTNPPKNDSKVNEDPVIPKRKECKATQELRAIDCASKTPKQKDAVGSYSCENGKLAKGDRLTTETSSAQKGSVGCVSEKAIATKTKNKACSNENNVQSSADRNSCKDGVTRFSSDLLNIDAAKAKGAGIKCFYEEEVSEAGKKKKYVTICNDKEDQEALKKLTADATGRTPDGDEKKLLNNIPIGNIDSETRKTQEGVRVASLDSNDAFRTALPLSDRTDAQTAGKTKEGVRVASLDSNDAFRTALPLSDRTDAQTAGKKGSSPVESFVTSNEGSDNTQSTQPASGSKVTQTGTGTRDSYVTSGTNSNNQQHPLAVQAPIINQGEYRRPSTEGSSENNRTSPSISVGDSNNFEKPMTQKHPLQVVQAQTGRSPSTPQARVATNSLFDSIFNRTQAPQQVTTNNTQIVPWYWQNDYLKPQQPSPIVTRTPEEKTVEVKTNALTKNLVITNQTQPGAQGVDTPVSAPMKMTPDEEAQARFLKSILDAPSVEEVMKRSGYDYQKLQQATKIKATADAQISQEIDEVPTILAAVDKHTDLITKNEKSPSKATLAYADGKAPAAETISKQTTQEEKQRVVLESIFAQQLKSGEVATKNQNLNKIGSVVHSAVTTEKVEVALEVAYKMLKNMISELNASQKPQLEDADRSKLANQLLSLSDYLQGSTFNADQPTADMMNAVSQQLEIAANRLAERASNETVLGSLKNALSELALEQQSNKGTTQNKIVDFPKVVGDWTPEHFAAYKNQITVALNNAKNPVAIKLYRDALSRISTAELFKQSNQAYWDSQADLDEAKTKVALARALDRSSALLSEPDTNTDETAGQSAASDVPQAETGDSESRDSGEPGLVVAGGSPTLSAVTDSIESQETSPVERKGVLSTFLNWIFGW